MKKRKKLEVAETSTDRKTELKLLYSSEMTIVNMSEYEQQIDNTDIFSYKNSDTLQEFITKQGRILSRRQTHLTAKQQRKLTKTIKRARVMGFLPFCLKS